MSTDPSACRHPDARTLPESDGGLIRFEARAGGPFTAGTVSVCPDCHAVVVRFDAAPPQPGAFGAAFVLRGEYLAMAGHHPGPGPSPRAPSESPSADPLALLLAEAIRSSPEARRRLLAGVLREAGKALRSAPGGKSG